MTTSRLARLVSGSVSQAKNEVDTKRHQNLASPFGGKATRTSGVVGVLSDEVLRFRGERVGRGALSESVLLGDGADAIRALGESAVTGPRGGCHYRRR